MEHSECGMASVAMMLNYYDYKIELSTLREEYGVHTGGFNLFQLKQILLDYNIDSKGVKISDITSFKKDMLPIIGFWKGKHFLVIERVEKDKILVADPAQGKKWIDKEEFNHNFSSIGLICTPNEKFEKNTNSNKLNFFLSILYKNKKFLISVLLLSILIQAFGITIPLLTQKLIDGINGASTNFINQIGFAILVSMVLLYILNFFRSFVITKFQTFFDKELMSSLFKHLLHLPYKFFTNRSSGELIFRMNSNVYIRQLLSQRIISIFIDSLLAVAYLIVMFRQSTYITFMVILISIFLLSMSLYQSNKIQQITDLQMIEVAKVQGVLNESINGVITIKSIGGEKTAFNKWEKYFDKQLEYSYKQGVLTSFLGNIPVAVQSLLNIFIIWYGSNVLSIGSLIAFNSVAIAFIQPILSLGNSYTDILLLKTYLNKIYDIFNTKEEDSNKSENITINSGNINIEDVSFGYHKFETILKNISLDIKSGEKIAVVGKSGCGKSSILKLLLGLYVPNSGKIYVDSVDISTINAKSLRSQIGVILQEPQLFNCTIKENILIGKENVSDENLNYAVANSGINDFLKNCPLGLNTIISESGSNFSGGQKQRIALARTLINKPKIILMDEPTSALDNESEDNFMKNIFDLESTCIVVSHRLSNIEKFDKIVIVDDGEIVGVGTHDELIKTSGIYDTIYNVRFAS